jgi:LacI family transcriptional regulator
MMLYTSVNVDETLRMSVSWNIEGMIVLGCLSDECQRYLNGAKTPIVFIDSYYNESDAENYVNVGLDDRLGGYMMTKHLISCGHKKIAFLANGNPPMGADLERLSGYKEALSERGIEFHAEDYIHISHKREKRHISLRLLLKERLRNYSALFFSSDFYAVDALNVLKDEGVNIPNEISVCGFDDNVYALQSRPMLTTVHQDVSQKAIHAIELLLKQIRGEAAVGVRLGIELCLRDSVSMR